MQGAQVGPNGAQGHSFGHCSGHPVPTLESCSAGVEREEVLCCRHMSGQHSYCHHLEGGGSHRLLQHRCCCRMISSRSCTPPKALRFCMLIHHRLEPLHIAGGSMGVRTMMETMFETTQAAQYLVDAIPVVGGRVVGQPHMSPTAGALVAARPRDTGCRVDACVPPVRPASGAGALARGFAPCWHEQALCAARAHAAGGGP